MFLLKVTFYEGLAAVYSPRNRPLTGLFVALKTLFEGAICKFC